ncbi:MAG: RHS repeat-associated core domain-containing protein, partial [Thermoanaerobaculales bacterium]|nr:RHS repeat-associated core domain-containing protein [Thermoanaerobaculales bacterium]
RLLFDEAGTVLEELEYLPFGALKGTGADPETTHLFTGHERDLGEGSSELDYMHARYYSPYLARFLSVDPVGGSVGSSQSQNRYSYVMNNPLKYTDPDGEWVHIAVGAGIGAVMNVGAKMIKNSVENKPLNEGLWKAAGVGALAGGVTAATFGMGAAVITGGGGAGAVATLSSAASIPTLNATGGLIVGATASGLGGAITGAGNVAVVEGNSDPEEIAQAAVEGALKSAVVGGPLGAAGAGPAGEAVAAELSTVFDAFKEYVYNEWVKSIPDPERESE